MVRGVAEQEIAVTYETLFELLRLEKSREELQQLSPAFFDDLVDYINEKKKILEKAEAKRDLFAINERDKTRNQLENIKRIVKELYEKREKKIILMAINKSRTGSDIVDTSALLEEEKSFFGEVLAVLDKHRNKVLLSLLEGRELAEAQTNVQVQSEEPPAKETKLVRFVRPVPKFVGKELEVYGPFEEEDMANLPVEIADVLVKKGRAQALD